MSQYLKADITFDILGSVSAGLALFRSSDYSMEWHNSTFKKQTWFGSALGGKQATIVTLMDLFHEKDHKAMKSMFDIALETGKAYDFQRLVRRGPKGSFPAELKFHRIAGRNGESMICLEITDLSLSKLYEQLETSHDLLRERFADLMAAQAELHYSLRMNIMSELGADIAHQLINPVTMCRNLLTMQHNDEQTPDAQADVNRVLDYLKDIENLAVWFRKFSNPKQTETQVCDLKQIVEDALSLNAQRFLKDGVKARFEAQGAQNSMVLAVPLNLITWLNAALSELDSIASTQAQQLNVSLVGSHEKVTLSVSVPLTSALPTLEFVTPKKFLKRLPTGAHLESVQKRDKIGFELELHCFTDMEPEFAYASFENSRITKAPSTNATEPIALPQSNKPFAILVDDEMDIRKILTRTFRNLGYEPLEASDGMDALRIIEQAKATGREDQISVVVSDVRMPQMTGPHLLIALREMGLALPFVFFSSNLVDEDNLDGFGDENVHFLTKESGLDALRALVQRIAPILKQNISQTA